MTIELILERGVVTIDDSDRDKFAGTKWHILIDGPRRYVCHSIGRRKVYLHRLIMNAPEGMHVDHINGNGLDNRRSNLRICTASQNARNQRKRKCVDYKGVQIRSGKYSGTTFWAHLKNIYSGPFFSAEDAAREYDRIAIETWGEFARTNF